MGFLFDWVFGEEKKKDENKKKRQKGNVWGLYDYEREEKKKGNYDHWNFEEEELEDDDYYFEDDK